MKKYIAIFCLLTLILAGCGKTSDAAPEPTAAPTTEETIGKPEQIIDAADSTLAGNWTATINKGQYASAIYYQSLDLSEDEAKEKATIFAKAEFPLNVILNLNEDGTYYFEIKPDDGTGFDTYVASFTAIANENGIELTEDDAKQMLTDARINKLFIMGQTEEGTWEHNDQGLLLSGWCTIHFRQEGDLLYWDNADDAVLMEDLPMCFKMQNA